MGVNTYGEEISSGSTVPDRQELTEKTCGFEQHLDNEKSLPRDTDCDVRILDQKPTMETGIPFNPFPRVPLQSSVLNTEHNKAQRKHTDEGDGFLSNTTTTLQSDADIENGKIELSHGALVSLGTDTSADDKCIQSAASASSLQQTGVRLLDHLYTNTNDDRDAMTIKEEIRITNNNTVKSDSSVNPHVDQVDEEGYTPVYKAALEGDLEGVKDLISQGANPNTPSKGGLRPLHAAAQGADVNVKCDLGQTPLHKAASGGYTSIADSLIVEGARVNKGDSKRQTPFNAAVQNGLLEDVKYLMNIKEVQQNSMTKLYAAASFGNLEVVKFFISNGADVNEEDDEGTIPLHGASINGSIAVMEYLIQQGSDVNKADAEGWTPFNASVQEGHLEAVKYLMKKGAKQNVYDKMTPLYAAAEFGHLEVVKFFISSGADVNEHDDEGKIPLHIASINGNVEVIEFLIQQGSDVNKMEAQGWTPLNAAVQEGHLGAVKYLMDKGAKQNRYAAMTPLYAASQFGHLDIVKFFLSEGVDVNEENDTGRIPLHDAAIHDNTEVLEYLIQQGSDVNKEDNAGMTPLNAAVQEGHLGAVKYLMDKGAKQNRYDGMTSLYAAARFGHLDVVEFFISDGADVNEEDEEGKIPLHGASINGSIAVMEYLIQQGSDVNKKDYSGQAPLHVAVSNGHLEVFQYIMAKVPKGTRSYGSTPLRIATQYDPIYVVKRLTSNGYDVNKRIECGKSPLRATCYNDKIDIANYLLLHNANVSEQDHDGCSPLHATAQGRYRYMVDYLTLNGADMDVKDIENLRPLQAAANTTNQHTIEGILSCEGDPDEEETVYPRAAGQQNIITRGYVKATKNEADTHSRTVSHVHTAEEETDCIQADVTKRGAGELFLENLSTMIHNVEKYAAHPNVNDHFSPRRGDENVEDTGDPLSGDHHYGAKHVTTKDHVKKKKKKVVKMKEAYTQARIEQLASHVNDISDGYDCTQTDNAKLRADRVSLKSLSSMTHDYKKGGNGEHNLFTHAKPKYPDKGEQDPTPDQMKAIKIPETRKRDTITNDTHRSSPLGLQTWQYSRFDPPSLQTMENDGHQSEEPESTCDSLIDENREMRESPSPMKVGNDLPINETSVKFESFPTHPSDVVHQNLYDGNPVSTQGTSSNPVWKIGTKRRTSVYRCPSILALVHTFLQVIIALAIILAGSPVLVAGRDITERVTLQAGKSGVVPFLFPWPLNSIPEGAPYFTLRFESKSRPFSVNGEPDIEGFKSPSQLPRFTTSVIDVDTSPCVNLMIDNVDTLDEDGYVLTAVWHSFVSVRSETVKKEIDVHIPPGSVKCFIALGENDDYPYEVHCRATTGSVATSLSCYQNDQKIDVKGDIIDNGLITSGIFLLPDNTHFSCCSHDVTLNVSKTICNDFEWPPSMHDKEPTTQIVNTVPTFVTNENSRPVNERPKTNPTIQIESHTESGACRQFMPSSVWYCTYLFVYLAFVTI